MSYTIIDADTHVTEAPDLWTKRAPASIRDRVPRVETDKDGTLRWVVGESRAEGQLPFCAATQGERPPCPELCGC